MKTPTKNRKQNRNNCTINKIIKILFIGIALLFVTDGQAQIWKKLKKKAAEAAERALENKVEEKTEKETSKAFDSVFNNDGKLLKKNKGKKNSKKNKQTANSNNEVNDENMSDDFNVYSKFDFVPGDSILLYDDFTFDNIGDFPAKWDTNGSGELVTINDEKWFRLTNSSMYIPLTSSSLPENYTIEFDMLMTGLDNKTSSQAFLVFLFADNNSFQRAKTWSMVEISPCQFIDSRGVVEKQVDGQRQFRNLMGKDYRDAINGTSRISIAANKSRLRVWLNENKIVDVPRLLGDGITNFKMFTRGLRDDRNFDEIYIKDFKMAETGIDLRSQLLTDGKFSTTGILFNSGSDQIKPESYGVLKQIANALLEDTSLNLNIIGHTDADGDAENNLMLSQQRAESVKNFLVGQFQIDENRLQTEGKGEGEPVADNTSNEGKANNRRVEFVKI